MSLHALSWVLKHSEAKNGARLVLIALADFAHDDGSKAFPSIETLMQHTRLGRTAVREALRRLKEDGQIVETGKVRSGTTIYSILMGSDSGQGGSDSVAEGSESDPDPSRNHQELLTAPPENPPVADSVQQVFAHWQSVHRKPRAILTPKRRRAIQARLREGFTVERLLAAIDGATHSDFHMGRHEKTRGNPQNELELLLRDGGRVEKFEALAAPSVDPDSWLGRNGARLAELSK